MRFRVNNRIVALSRRDETKRRDQVLWFRRKRIVSAIDALQVDNFFYWRRNRNKFLADGGCIAPRSGDTRNNEGIDIADDTLIVSFYL